MPTIIGGEWEPRAVAAFWSINAMGLPLVLAMLGWLSWTTRRAARWTDLIVYGLAIVAMIAVPRLCLDLESLESLPVPYVLWLFVVGMAGLFLTISRWLWPQRAVNLGGLLLILVAPALLVGPLLTAVSQAREAAKRTTCKSHLKQIGLGLHNYHETYSVFPAAVTGEPDVSWRILLLPYLNELPLSATYDQTKPWDSPVNDLLSKGRVWVYECPSNTHHRDAAGRFRTDFAMLTGKGAFGDTSRTVAIDDITDGASNTIAIVEASGLQIIWTEPRDFDVTKGPIGINLKGASGFESPGMMSSYHTKGAYAILASGHVQFINKSIDPELLKKLTTIDREGTIGQDF
ncbi:MAG: hypothetical protein JWP89_1866 [Schlesneria sp.]|nr:hypothetical protein [Schlesneria sp.]